MSELFRTYAISDRHTGSLLPTIRASQPGVLGVQLRDKDLPAAARLEEALGLRAICTEHGAVMIVGGGSVELALQVGADGVHVPAHHPIPQLPGLLVGCSCHDAGELERAVAAGADFVTLSPVLFSPGKAVPLGWSRFEPLARSCPIPVFALGGITPSMLSLARDKGAWGVAGIRGFLQDAEPLRNSRPPKP